MRGAVLLFLVLSVINGAADGKVEMLAAEQTEAEESGEFQAPLFRN